ncbi:hypothetical protein DWY37_03715 [Roseburia sp. AF25-13LB]|uniref:structural cement protein Gp24 n=1 Tax=Roseburia sp. AF25-13LB TaxID=2293132 RepID=UPI000E4E09E1|nr:hypothetical protein [Roseburia sp. AF25-13LB]RHQ50905.1 hypothetical protein DWY37_03715 [Roseburia sp. AF25-13LB]
MSTAVQTSYGFGFPKGVAGGLFDLSAHDVTTRQAEGDGVAFGLGVVVGTNKGTDVKLPATGATSDDFEGVVVHNSVMVEKDMDNNVSIDSKRTVGCLHFGRIWVQTGEKAKPVYKDKVFLITDGAEAGKFTTSADSSATKVEVNAIFLGETDDGIANVEFRPGAVVKNAE